MKIWGDRGLSNVLVFFSRLQLVGKCFIKPELTRSSILEKSSGLLVTHTGFRLLARVSEQRQRESFGAEGIARVSEQRERERESFGAATAQEFQSRDSTRE